MFLAVKRQIPLLVVVALGLAASLLLAGPAWARPISRAELRRVHLLVHRGGLAASHTTVTGSHLGLYLVAAFVAAVIVVTVALVRIWPARDARSHVAARGRSGHASRHAA